MKPLTIVSILLMAANFGYCQNNKNPQAKFSVKLYNLSTWDKEDAAGNNGLYPTLTTDKQFQLLHPTAAFRFIVGYLRHFHFMMKGYDAG